MLICSVQIISLLENQSKFQMFTLFSSRHIGVPKRNYNLAAPYLASKICEEHFHKYGISTLGQRTVLKLGELPSLFIFYYITIS